MKEITKNWWFRLSLVVTPPFLIGLIKWFLPSNPTPFDKFILFILLMGIMCIVMLFIPEKKPKIPEKQREPWINSKILRPILWGIAAVSILFSTVYMCYGFLDYFEEFRKQNLIETAGTVLDEQGAPIEGVQVYLVDFHESFLTDQKGYFLIEISKETFPNIEFVELNARRAGYRHLREIIRLGDQNLRLQMESVKQ